MRKKTKTFNKIVKVLAELGFELKRQDILSSFENDRVSFLVDVDEEEETFALIEIVVGLNGELTQNEFDLAMDVVKIFHKDYVGRWNNGKSYLSSPLYSLKGLKNIPKVLMKQIVKGFWEAYICMYTNVCMATDDTVEY